MGRDRFFDVLESLLEQEGSVSLQEILNQGGPQHTYGLAISLLAATAFIPGVTNILALGIVALGVQMAAGLVYPWIPQVLLRQKIHRGRIKNILTKAGRFLDRLGPRTAPKGFIPRRLLGLLITWTALLLALPLPLPLSNLLPGAALLLMGIALLEDRASAAWMGLVGSLATTIYFALSFDLVMKAMKAMWHLRHLTD